MTIILRPEQEQVLTEAVRAGVALTTDEALDRAIDALRERLPERAPASASVADAAHRLANFGKRHGLSLGGLTIKELLRESRP